MNNFELRDTDYVRKINTNLLNVAPDSTRYFEKLAVEYIEREMSITPVVFKKPYLNGWQKLREEEVLSQNWYKGANGIGLLTGQTTGIICLDIDIVNPNDKVRVELEKMLPPIFSGKIGSPLKPAARFYRYNYEATERFNNIDVELLSDGCQTVLPDSEHDIYNKKYEWVGKSLLEIDVDELPDLPPEVIPYLRMKDAEYERLNGNKRASGGKTGSKGLTLTGSDFKLIHEAGRCKHNSYNKLSYFAVFLCKEGHDFDYVVDQVYKKDEEINKDSDYFFFNCPSRPEFKSNNRLDNCEKFVKHIFNKHAASAFNIRDILNVKQYNYFRPKLLKGFTSVKEKKNGKLEVTRQHADLYKFLRALHEADYIPERKSFAIWNGNYFVFKSDDYIKMFAQKYYKNPSVISIGDRNTFLELVKHKNQSSVSDYALKDTGFINLENGVYSLRTKSLLPIDRSYKFVNKINAQYIENAECPTWDELLNNITLGRKHFQTAIEEFVGYAISGSDYNRFNKILVLDGGGSNGKSTLIRIIQDLIGQENSSSVSLVSIGKERFAGFGMVNKLINFCSEEPNEAFTDSGYLKKITGGDPIMVEEKNKGAFTAQIMTKFIVSYNKMPYFPDDSAGMRRRMMIIKCDLNYDITPGLKILDVEDKIAMEKSGVLYRCLKAFEEVQKRGSFTYIPESDERLDEMIVKSNPVLAFAREYLILTNVVGSFVPTDLLYDKFLAFQGQRTQMTKRAFSDQLFEVLRNENEKLNAEKVGLKRGVKYDSGRGFFFVQLKTSI